MRLAIAGARSMTTITRVIQAARSKPSIDEIWVIDPPFEIDVGLQVRTIVRRADQSFFSFRKTLFYLAIDILLLPVDVPKTVFFTPLPGSIFRPQFLVPFLFYPAHHVMLTMDASTWVPWNLRHTNAAFRLLAIASRNLKRPWMSC
jgi:hypothetical protein